MFEYCWGFLSFVSILSFIFDKCFGIHSQCVYVAKGISNSTAGAKNRRRETFTLYPIRFLYQFMCHLFDSHAHTGFARLFLPLFNRDEAKKKTATSHPTAASQ
jgi:hypothetical protein